MRFWGSSKLDEIGWCWMHIQAWIWWQGILLQSQFSLFLCILKPEAYAQKLDRSKTPAQLHIMNWHPDGMVFIRRDLSSIHKHIIKLNLSCWLSKTTLWLRWFTRWPSVDSWGDDDLFPACNEHFPVLCRFGPVAKFWREQSYPGWEGCLSQQGHQRPGVWLWFPRCLMEKEASCGHLECEGRRRTDAFRVSCFDELAADFMILHRWHSVIPRMEDGGAALIFLHIFVIGWLLLRADSDLFCSPLRRTDSSTILLALLWMTRMCNSEPQEFFVACQVLTAPVVPRKLHLGAF